MFELMVPLTILSFICTILFIFWRPHVNEAIPATVGAAVVFLSGSVSLSDLGTIAATIGGAAITIMATIVMAIVLESFGFFQWAAEKLVEKAKGSGIRLFWCVNLLCFLMTLFVNNDGSILITTPILLLLLQHMGLKKHQKIPYLLSGALTATASSAPIGVSNIVNLIALKIVHMDLYMHTAMMFVPATLGLVLLVILLFVNFYKDLPRTVPTTISGLWNYSPEKRNHPLKGDTSPIPPENRVKFMRNILIFVLCVRVSLFVASYFQVPVALAAVFGSLILLGWRWYRLRISPADKKNTLVYPLVCLQYVCDYLWLTQHWINPIADPIPPTHRFGKYAARKCHDGSACVSPL
jgi:arsenical pump membrane protein